MSVHSEYSFDTLERSKPPTIRQDKKVVIASIRGAGGSCKFSALEKILLKNGLDANRITWAVSQLIRKKKVAMNDQHIISCI